MISTFASALLHAHQAIGIVNALKTGNVAVDMAIAMCIPIIIKLMFGVSGTAFSKVGEFFSKAFQRIRPQRVERTIQHTSSGSGSDNNSDDATTDTKNMVLIKAIQMYLHFHGDLTLNEAGLELSRLTSQFAEDSDDEDEECKSFADMLSKYQIIKSLPVDEWIPLGKFGPGKEALEAKKDGGVLGKEQVKLIFKSDNNTTEQSEDSGYGSERKTTVTTTTTMICLRSDKEYAIDTFVNTALNWYLGELRKLDTKTRYFYELDDDIKDNSHQVRQLLRLATGPRRKLRLFVLFA